MTGNEIKAFRESLGWTQQQLADYWGITRHNVWSHESLGDKEIPKSRMFELLVDQLSRKIQSEKLCSIATRAAQFVDSEAEVFKSCSTVGGVWHDKDAETHYKKMRELHSEISVLIAGIL